MPANKEAFIRFRIIDRLLRNKRQIFPSMDDIIDELETKLGKTFSESTIQKDIKAMKEDPLLGFLAPIKYNKKFKGYHYTDPNYTIAEIPLSDDDIASIEFAATVLQQFKDVKLFSEFGSAVDKIFNAVNVSSLLNENELEDTIQFEKVPYFKGSEWIGRILNHIKERHVIAFDYTKFNSTETKKHVIHPFLLKEYRNRWYLIGMFEKNDRIATFGLDRLSNIQMKDIPFRFHQEFSSKNYFQHAFGITTFEGNPEEVILSFSAFQGPYLKTQPLHHTQQIVSENETEIIISLTVGVTTELVMSILSYGNDVKVVQPATLQQNIKDRLEASLRNY